MVDALLAIIAGVFTGIVFNDSWQSLVWCVVIVAVCVSIAIANRDVIADGAPSAREYQ